MSAPPPSPITNPSRSWSNGRDAASGSSLRVDSAFIDAKPPIVASWMPASTPPAIIRSASPRRIVSQASPSAWPPVAHADTVAKLGPIAPVAMATWPGAHVRDAHRDEERRDPVGSSLAHDQDVVEQRGHAAQARADDHARPRAHVVVQAAGQAGLVERLAGADERELDVAVRAPHLLAVEDVGRVEVLDLGGDLDAEPGRVEVRDRRDAGASGDEPVPGRGHVVAERRDRAHAGDDHPARRSTAKPSSSHELPGADGGRAVDVAGQAARA